MLQFLQLVFSLQYSVLSLVWSMVEAFPQCLLFLLNVFCLYFLNLVFFFQYLCLSRVHLSYLILSFLLSQLFVVCWNSFRNFILLFDFFGHTCLAFEHFGIECSSLEAIASGLVVLQSCSAQFFIHLCYYTESWTSGVR